jgi:hypothetical protein
VDEFWFLTNNSRQKACSEVVRDIQREHMIRWGYPDIGYNFIIGNNGLVYEGTGWDYRGTYAFGEKMSIFCGPKEFFEIFLL